MRTSGCAVVASNGAAIRDDHGEWVRMCSVIFHKFYYHSDSRRKENSILKCEFL